MKQVALTIAYLVIIIFLQARQVVAQETTFGLKDYLHNSEFHIGAALNNYPYFNDPSYQETLLREFNSISTSGEMKWRHIYPQEGQYQFEAADDFVQVGEQHNLRIHGHSLLSNDIPDWVKDPNLSREARLQTMENHITTVVTRYQNRVDSWDVVNEVATNEGGLRDFIWNEGTTNETEKQLIKETITRAFQAAHQADPSATLIYNEGAIPSLNARSDAAYELVQHLLSQNVPIHGFGFQTHIFDHYQLNEYQQNLQRFANLGIDIYITEADVALEEPVDAAKLELQKNLFEDMIQACFNVSRCHGITVWGVTDKVSWINDHPAYENYCCGLLFNDAYQPKPAYTAFTQQFETQFGPPTCYTTTHTYSKQCCHCQC